MMEEKRTQHPYKLINETQVQSTVTQDNPIYLFLIYTRSLRKDITMSILLHNWFRRAAVFHDKHWMLGWLNLQHTEVSFHSESINIFRKEKHYRFFFFCLFLTAFLSPASCTFFPLFFSYTCKLLSFSTTLHKGDYKTEDGANGKAKQRLQLLCRAVRKGSLGWQSPSSLLPTGRSALWSS